MTEPDADLLDAVRRYEQALARNDVPALDALFAPGAGTIRSADGATLVGHDAIAEFRRARASAPVRSMRQLHVRPLGQDAAVVVVEALRDDGGTTAQTQVWQRGEAGWQVTSAHVSSTRPPEPPAPLTPEEHAAVWRVTDVDVPDAETPGPDAPLAGRRLAVKDLFAVAGQRVGAGTPDWLASAPVETRTAPPVRALLEAGCTFTGIAHTDELAYSVIGANVHHGTPPNRAAPGRVSGGSTSGPAAAVAAGVADVALGTDTAGSVRVPASWCGLHGLRTTHDAVTREGLVGLAPSFDTVGVLTRTADELAAAADVLLPAGPDAPAERLVLWPALLDLVGDAVRTATVAGARALALRAGVPLRTAAGVGPDDLEAWFTAFRTVQAAEAWREHGAFSERARLGADVAARFRTARDVTDAQERDAREVLAAARARLRGELADGTVLVLPATADVAPRRDATASELESTRAATLRLTCLASLGGLPALSLPLAHVGGWPLGVCVVGAPGTDRTLLRLATTDVLRR